MRECNFLSLIQLRIPHHLFCYLIQSLLKNCSVTLNKTINIDNTQHVKVAYSYKPTVTHPYGKEEAKSIDVGH